MFGKKNVEIINKGNVVIIKKPEATYTIIYGIHVRGQKVEDIPKDIDGLFLESGTFPWFEDPAKCVRDLSKHMQYNPLFATIEKEQIPILLGDVMYKYNDLLMLLLDTGVSTTQWFVGYRMLQSLLGGNDKKKKQSVAQKVVVGGIAAWMLLPTLATMLRLGSSFMGVAEKETSALKRFAHKVHPESEVLFLTVRNAAIAEKVSFFAQKLGKKPHIAIILGAGHVGVEDMLVKSSDERMKILLQHRGILKRLVREDYFAGLAEITFTKNQWKTEREFTVPELQQIIS